MVVWFIGLSASGKTTASKYVYEELKKKAENVVLVDGDLIREIFSDGVDHSIEGRRKNAERISKLCYFLDRQGIHVVAAVLSIFPEWREWNRKKYSRYIECYVRADLDNIKRRDVRGLYRRADFGEEKNVVGYDIPFPEPVNQDLTISNDATMDEFIENIRELLVSKLIPMMEAQ